MERFDVIVVGTGVAGQTAAPLLAAAGRRVAIVDRREYGGTCALRGCEPKKVLFEAAAAAESARGLARRGVAGGATVDWGELIASKRTFTDPKPAEVEAWLASEGIATLHGAARFTGPDTLDVAGTPYGFGHALVATGAAPIDLGIPGADLVWDAERFMAAETLPPTVAFIGGGFISFEFAHIAAAAGAKSTILHRSARALCGFDADLSALLIGAYRDAGIDVRTNAPVVEVREGSERALEVVCGDGHILACDAVVHGAGRAPDVGGLDPGSAGVGYSARGLEVDDYLCAAGNERVYAAGDASDRGAQLTPVAIAQARVAARNILSARSARFEAPLVPSVCFSLPVLATVGLSQEEAAQRGLDVDIRFSDMSTWASTRRTGDRVAAAKVLLERETGRVLGAHLLGRNSGELVNVFALAITHGMTGEELRGMLWAYPTAVSEVGYLVG